MNRLARSFVLSLSLALVVVACGPADTGTAIGEQTEFLLPKDGTCEAGGMLEVANNATFDELDDDVALDRRATENIVAARPIASLLELDNISYVGISALKKIFAYAGEQGHLSACHLPIDGSCEAGGMLKLVNTASFEELDDDVALDKRAAENIVAARPIATLTDLDNIAYVGESALKKIFDYASEHGYLEVCSSSEVGIVSDLDKTVVPPANPDLSKAPYPGVTKLYQILEHRNQGAAGDMYYVTARQPEMVTEIPDYLETHGVPAGPIETGISGLPWVAQPEKVADVSKILDAAGEQRFVLLGDSSHRDPEVYKEILALYPERIIAGFIHKVNNTVAPHRVEGLHLHESYAEVAAILYGLDVISADEALEVMKSAQAEGLAITDEQMQALLDEQS